MAVSTYADDHGYYDTLAAKGETTVSRAYRTQQEIDDDAAGTYPTTSDAVYDAVEDACKLPVPEDGDAGGDMSIELGTGLYASFSKAWGGTGSIFIFYETKHESDFGTKDADGEVWNLARHKAVHLIDDKGRVKAFEPGFKYDEVGTPSQSGTEVAKVDIRVYYDDPPQGEGWVDAFTLDGSYASSINIDDKSFIIQTDTWTRHWLFLDFTNDKVYYWIGDESNANELVTDEALDYDAQWNGPELGQQTITDFWFEWDSSSTAQGSSPQLDIWVRNLIIMEDISYATAQGYVDDGDFLTGSATPWGGVNISKNTVKQD
jgi:hypothetical protein